MTDSFSILHYTSNHLDKVNPRFAERVRAQILKSAGEYPIISVSQKPMDFGQNVCIGKRPRGHLEIYKAILIAAQNATTEYVGLAEDDIFYTNSHWTTHRPPLHRFAYDLNRWGINTWMDPPVFGYRARPVVNQLIAPRQLLIDALEERFAKFPDESKVPLKFWGEFGRYEAQLGVKVREFECFAAPDPSVVFSHEEAFGFLSQGKRKSIGEARRTSLPFWGSAERMAALYRQSESVEV